MDRDRFEISVDDVLKTTKGEHLCGPLCSFNGIATDTRMMGQGQLFIPLTGENFDGHEYLSQARQKGALGALVSGDFDLDDDTLEAFETDFVLIRVKDTHQALLDIAALWRRTFSDLTVIAVTGTNGKTTTKEMLRWLLSAVGPTLASVKSYNNHIGVPITLLDIRPYHKFAIVELGASAAGEITPLARAVSPDVAVVTNVGTAHLEKFGSVRKIAETKAEIVKAVRPNGFVVLNGDDRSYPLFLENAKTKTITYAVDSSHADIQPTEVVMQTSSIHFDIFGTSTKLPMGGKHNLYNALAALTVIDGLGLDSARSANRLRGFTPPPMRGNIFYVGPVVIVNDAFNCNPSSLKASLEYFEHIPAPNKVFVLGDMLELGKESEKYHREAGKALADSSAEVFVAFGDEAANSYAEFRSNSEKDAMHLPKGSHRKVADYLVPLVENGAVVFFKGSRKLKLERAVSELIRGLKNHYLRERAELED